MFPINLQAQGWRGGEALGTVAESFFHTLKTELIDLEDFATRGHAQTAVFESIEVFYHHQCCHSANGDLAPLADEQVFKTHGLLCPEKC
jgi:transposase InsO family protein